MEPERDQDSDIQEGKHQETNETVTPTWSRMEVLANPPMMDNVHNVRGAFPTRGVDRLLDHGSIEGLLSAERLAQVSSSTRVMDGNSTMYPDTVALLDQLLMRGAHPASSMADEREGQESRRRRSQALLSLSALQETTPPHSDVSSLALALLSTEPLFRSTSAALGPGVWGTTASDLARTTPGATDARSNNYASDLTSSVDDPTRLRTPSLSTLITDQQQSILLASLQQQYQRGNQDANTVGNHASLVAAATNTAIPTRRNEPDLPTTTPLLQNSLLASRYYSNQATGTHHQQLRIPPSAAGSTGNTALLQSLRLLQAVQEQNQVSRQEKLSSQAIADILISSRNRLHQGDANYIGNSSLLVQRNRVPPFGLDPRATPSSVQLEDLLQQARRMNQQEFVAGRPPSIGWRSEQISNKEPTNEPDYYPRRTSNNSASSSQPTTLLHTKMRQVDGSVSQEREQQSATAPRASILPAMLNMATLRAHAASERFQTPGRGEQVVQIDVGGTRPFLEGGRGGQRQINNDHPQRASSTVGQNRNKLKTDSSNPTAPSPAKPASANTKQATLSQQQQHEPFPEKLHRLIREAEAEDNDSIVSFTPDGAAFSIHKPTDFFEKIVPRYFRISHLSSFKRQLNLYGFEIKPSGPSKGAYSHKYFQRQRPELCVLIRRKDSQFGISP